ncbi:MAG: hypothetical protein J1F61_04005 [Clostridiales bacterium]|nr:hypothetical protein [Clostridiales bacterium]
MISYDNYLNRIQKIAKFKSFVHKFRFLIIGVFSLIIATTTGLLVAKGTVTTAMSLPTQIIFGDDYAPTAASAFMSSVSYEYSLEGSGEWSSKKPVKTGKYLARTVTKKTVGNGYSKPISFEILPREAEFTIGSDSVVYGNVPANCSVSDLVSGHRLVSADLIFEYESYTEKITQVDVVPSSVKIIDGSGEDFTDCYDITFFGKELEILPRSITLQADSVVHTYSDEAVVVANEVSENSKAQLAYGDTITVKNVLYSNGEQISAPKYIGNYEIRVVEESVKIMNGNIDVTHHYYVKTLSASLTINARKITITTGSDEKIYDGNSLQDTEFTANGIISGHKISPLYEYPTLTNVGEIDNENTYSIADGAGNDVTDNYNIKVVYGTLKITKRAITVKTGDAKREYDGSKLFNYSYEIISGSIVYGQKNYVINDDFGIYNVSESGVNNKLILAIEDEAGRDISKLNYDITYKYGTLTLTPRTITIETNDGYKIYDGDPLEDSTIVINDRERLVAGHTVAGTNTVSITNAGSVLNEINFIIRDGYGNYVTDNYKITTKYGTLTVDKRPIVVTAYTPSPIMFDGEWHSDTHYETSYYNADKPGLVKGDTLTVSNAAKIRDVGTIANTFNVVDESGNYDIIGEVIPGVLEVYARPITVVMDDARKEYDGTPLSKGTYRTFLSGAEGEAGLIGGDTLIQSGALSQITDAKIIDNECPYIEPNSNYVITRRISGKLEVYARAITVELENVTIKYGDIIQYPYEGGYRVDRLVDGESLKVFVTFSGLTAGKVNDVGTYTIWAIKEQTVITKQNGDDSTSNYNIDYVEATLTIERRDVNIKTEGNTKVYDGDPLSNGGAKATSGLLAGHEIYIYVPFSIINVDDSCYDQTIYAIRDIATREDVTDNYNDIIYDYGYLEVTARPITVKTVSDSKVYDGEPLENAGYTTYYYSDESKSGLLNGDELDLVKPVSITDVGNGEGIKNECKYEVPNSNYEIKKVVAGTLKVTPRKIIYTTLGAEKVYDKTPLTNAEYTTKYYLTGGDSNGNTAGLIGDDKLILVGELASIINKGEASNANVYVPANSNYEIYDHKYGILTVTAREIVVVTGSALKKYDGTPLTCTTYTTYYYGDKNEIGLFEGDGELTLIGEPASITNHGEMENICEYSVPSANYVIADYDYGTLKIILREITVIINNIESVTYGEIPRYPTGKNNFQNYDTCGLVNGEQIEIGVYFMMDNTRVEPKNTGVYEILPDVKTIKIYDKDGNIIWNELRNYVISDCQFGYAEILKKNIIIERNSAQVTTYGDEFELIYTLEPNEFPYGEQINVGFHYSKIGENGPGYDSPVHVGKYIPLPDSYKCTVYTQDGVLIDNGIHNYQLWYSNYAVIVNPRPITVQLHSIKGVQYGNEYSYPTQPNTYAGDCDLAYDDRLTVYGINMPNPADLPEVGTYKITATGVLINGTKNIDYEVQILDGELEIVPREIIVINLGAEKIYDGTPLSSGAYTTRQAGYSSKPGLIGEDTLTLIGELTSITNVGEIPNANRYTAGSNYKILEDSYIDQMLVVKPRKIVIASDSDEWEYDGQYHSLLSWDESASYHINEKGEREPALVLEHRFVVGDSAKIKDVGEIRNIFENVKILDGEDDVTYNYEIDLDNTATGTLKITPRTITVTTDSKLREYNGEPLTESGYSVRHSVDENKPALVSDDELTLIGELESVTNVWEGVVKNANEYEGPIGIYGNANYDITYDYGTLQITARKITVEIGDKVKEYSTAPYNFGGKVDNYKNYLECNLADGEKLHIEVNFTDANGKIIEKNSRTFRYNVGTYGMLLDTDKCLIYKDGVLSERGIENYDIECEGSTYTVIPRKATITQNDIQATYGDKIEYNGYKGGEDLQYFWGVQEQLTFTYHFETEYGEIVSVSDKLRAGSYLICVDEDSVRVDGASPDNYDFTFVDGVLIVTPREVVVTLQSLTAIYGDGLPAYPAGKGNYESAVSLAYNDTLQVFVRILADERPNAGEYDIVIDEEKYALVNGVPDTSDYYFTFNKGTLTVKKADLTIILNDVESVTYGDTLHYYSGGETVEGLVYGETLEIAVYYTDESGEIAHPRNAGKYSVNIDLENSQIPGSENGLGNYEVHCEHKTAEIYKLTLKIALESVEYVYDGTAHGYNQSAYTIEEGKTVYGEFLNVFVNYYDEAGKLLGYAPSDAGRYTVEFDKESCLVNGGWMNANINYDIECEDTYNYVITPAELTVTLEYAEYTYGDEINYAKSDSFVVEGLFGTDAFDCTVKYYYLIDGEKGEEIVGTPKNVGDYAVEFDSKTVKFTRGKLSNYTFAEEMLYGTIKINEKSIIIRLYTDLTMVYGEEFAYPSEYGNYANAGAEGLVAGEEIQVFAYLVADKAIPDVGLYDVVADESATVIKSGYLSNYSITYIKGQLEILRRTITVASQNEYVEYDGYYHYPQFTLDESESYHLNEKGERERALVSDDHYFVVVESKGIKNVGWIYNTSLADKEIYDIDGNRVTDNYEIDEKNTGKLIVYKRAITVTTGDADKEYDGDELFSNYAEVTKGTLADNQRFELSLIYTIINVSETKAENNASKIAIYDEYGEYVTENYDITYTNGTLTVTPRKIVVVTADGEWVYDGKYHSKTTDYKTYHFGAPEEDGLFNGDTLSVVGDPAAIINYGSIENVCKYSPDSTNYEIVEDEYSYGTLTVTQRHITVETLGGSKFYDGEELYNTGYDTHLTEDMSKTGLIFGDGVTLALVSNFISIINVDESCDNILEFALDGDIYNNYVIDDHIYGYLEITPRPILIETATDSKIYDGEPLRAENATVTLYALGMKGDGLIGDDVIEYSNWAYITEVGSIDNVCNFVLPGNNYTATIRYGKLTVTKADLTVVLNDVDSVDYGQTLQYSVGGEIVEGLLAGETLEIEVYYTSAVNGEAITPKNAGIYYIYLDLVNSKITGSENGLGNYEVHCEYKTAEINKLTLKIELVGVGEFSHGYDGTTHEYPQDSFIILDGNIAYGEVLAILVNYYKDGTIIDAPKDAGNYTIKVDTSRYYIDGDLDEYLNYEIVCESEYEYVITPAEFTVNLTDYEVMYNGSEFRYSPLNGFEVEGLFGSDEIECNVKYTLNGEEVTAPKNAGVYGVEFDTNYIVFKNGNRNNYTFVDSGNYISQLTISPRPIRVIANSRETERETFDGTDESYTAVFDGYQSYPAFVENDEEYVTAIYYYNGSKELPESNGTYALTVELVNKYDDYDVMSNYNVVYVDGLLTLTPRKVLVTPDYNGNEIEYNGYAVDLNGKLDFSHVHMLNGIPYDEYGFREEDLEGLTVTYTLTQGSKKYTITYSIVQGELKYAGGEAPKNAGTYRISIEISGYNPDDYQVQYGSKTFGNVLVITKAKLYITSISSSKTQKEYDKLTPEEYGVNVSLVVGSGLVEPDRNLDVIYQFIDSNGNVSNAVNAGTYIIGVKVVDPTGADNYEIYAPEVTFTVTPITLYIKPINKSSLYNGKDLVYLDSDYTFVDKEALNRRPLDGDIIVITPSIWSLAPSRAYATVTITGVMVYEENTLANMTGNYNIYYTYDRTVMGSNYSSSDFKGSLQYEIRTVYYRQIVPEGQDDFTYDGTTKTITGNRLYEIVYDGEYGIFADRILSGADYIVINSSTIGPNVGQYDYWLSLGVKDFNRNIDVSNVYNLQLLDAGKSAVTISEINITLKIDSTLTTAELDKLNECSAFLTPDASVFEGRYVLDKDYYSITGIKSGLEYDVIAIKSNGEWNFAVVIYERKSTGSLSDKSEGYKLYAVEKGEYLSVHCRIVECHSLTNIRSDIALTLIDVSYDDIAAGIGLTTYDDRPALRHEQYKIEGLLPGHTATEVVVIRSNGLLTFAVLVTNGKSDRSYYYNLIPPECPSDKVNFVLVSSLAEIQQDVSIEITADLQKIIDGEDLEEIFDISADGKLVLKDTFYTVDGLLDKHSVQIVAMMTAGRKVTFAVLIYENKVTSSRSDLYNLYEIHAPEGADVILVYSFSDVLTDITITLNADVTAENLAADLQKIAAGSEGSIITKSEIDGRLVLAEGTFTIEKNFGKDALATGHEIEIIVDIAEDGSFNLYVVIYQLSASGKRNERSYLYTVTCNGAGENINLEIKTLPLGDEGLLLGN